MCLLHLYPSAFHTPYALNSVACLGHSHVLGSKKESEAQSLCDTALNLSCDGLRGIVEFSNRANFQVGTNGE